MLAGPHSGELLERMFKDPDSFVRQDTYLIDELSAKLEAGNDLTSEKEQELMALLSADTRFFLSLAFLKVNLARQRRTLGWN